MRLLFIVPMLAVAVTLATSAQETTSLHLMPWPASVKSRSPQPLVIQTSFTVGLANASDPGLRRAVEIFLNDLRRHTGSLPLDFTIGDVGNAQLKVNSDHASKPVQELGEDESYTLEVTSSGGATERTDNSRRYARIADFPSTG